MYYSVEASCSCNRGKVRKNNEDNFYFDGRCLPRENNGLRHAITMRASLRKEQCLAVFDGGNEFTKEDQEILDSVKDFNHVIVFNKKDTYKDTKNGVEVSAKTGEGLEELKRELFNKSFSQGVDRNAELITEERHLFALKKALEFANSAINGIKLNVPLDIVSEDVKYCWSALGEITGKTASEEIIDEIFAKFCVGK